MAACICLCWISNPKSPRDNIRSTLKKTMEQQLRQLNFGIWNPKSKRQILCIYRKFREAVGGPSVCCHVRGSSCVHVPLLVMRSHRQSVYSVGVYDGCAEATCAWCGLCPRMPGWRLKAAGCYQFSAVGYGHGGVTHGGYAQSGYCNVRVFYPILF